MASFLGALSLSSCSGNAKNKEMTDNGMILGYIDKTEGTDMLPIVPQPALYEG